MKLKSTPSFFILFLFLATNPAKLDKSPGPALTQYTSHKQPFVFNSYTGGNSTSGESMFATTVETLQSGCAVPDVDFNLGESICGRITSDIFSQLKFQWEDPAGIIRREGVALVSSPQTDSWTLPSTRTTEVSPGLFIDNRGTWKLNAALVSGGVQANWFFRVHDPANPLAELVLNATASPDPVTAGSNVTYFFNATQNGPDAAQNVVFTATIPQHTTFVSLVAPAGWTVNAPSGGTVTATRATWAAFPLNVATSPDMFQLTVTAIAGTVNTTPLASVGTIFSTTEDRQLYTNYTSAQVIAVSATSGPSIIPQGDGLLSESCMPANGSIDPGETVTVTFEVRNAGNQTANNVIGTLLATNNVTSPPAPVSFGNIAAGATVTRDITFIANPAAPCGSGLIPSISFTSDGGANRGTAVFPRLNMLSTPSGPSNIPRCCSAAPACIISCPANITVSNDANQCGAVVNYPPPTTTGTCGTVTVTPATGSFFPVGTTTVTATTSAGPSCSFTITVNDTQPPSVTCPANITTNAAAGTCGAVVNYSSPTVSDNCPGVSVVGVPVSGSVFPVGTTTVTVTATDASGNTATCSFTVTVNDNTAPTVSCPANISVPAGAGGCTASVNNPNPTTSDACGVTTQTWAMTGATVASSPGSGIQTVGTRTFNSGVTTVTYTVRDAANNTSTCTYTVTVTDNQPPTVTCPANMTANNTPGICAATLTPAPPTNSDNCAVTRRTWVLTGATTGSSPASGINTIPATNFNVGITTVTYTVADAANNTATCSFTVTVNDTEPPTFGSAAPVPDRLYYKFDGAGTTIPNLATAPPAGTATANIVGGTLSQGSTGKCGGALIGTGAPTPGNHVNTNWAPNMTTPWSIMFWLGPNQIDANPSYLFGSLGAGAFRAFYGGAAGANNILVRGGSGDILITGVNPAATFITIVYNGTNTVVYKNGASPTTYAVTFANTGPGPFLVGGYDNTGFTFNGRMDEFGMYSRALSAAEVAALAATCPTAATSCPANITVNNTPGLCSATVTFTPPVGADNCPGVTTTQIQGLASGSVFPVGTTTNIFRATDAAGNQATCTFTVTVNDNQAPTITCPTNITQPSVLGTCTASVTTPAPTNADNCGVVTRTWAMTGATTGSSAASGINSVGTQTFNLGVTIVTYTVRDAAGNQTSCSFTVTITDAQLPVISVHPQNRVACAGDNVTMSVTAAPLGGTVPLTFQWQVFNGTAWVNITGATGPSHNVGVVTTANNHTSFRVIVSSICTNLTSNVGVLDVNPLPIVSITPSRAPMLRPGESLDLTLVGSPAGGSVVWRLNGTQIGTGTTLTGLTVNEIGTITAVYTDPNGCINTASIDVTGEPLTKVFIYPSPNNGHFQVRFFNTPGQEVRMNIYDSKGRLVFNQDVTTGIQYTSMQVDLSKQESGIYIVELVNGSGARIGAGQVVIHH